MDEAEVNARLSRIMAGDHSDDDGGLPPRVGRAPGQTTSVPIVIQAPPAS